MFEKDAEEIMNNHCDCEMLSECLAGIRTRCTDFEESKKLLIEGIEFGYNKALEEIGDLRDCCNCKHWKYSTRSLSYYCDKTSRIDDCQLQYYRCEHWER